MIQERKEREFDPTISVLRDCLARFGVGEGRGRFAERVKEALGFMEARSDWGDQMLKLEPSTLKLGSKIKDLLKITK